MKQLFFFLAVLLVFGSCSSPRTTPQIKFNDETEAVDDSLEYNLETFDARFETWYIMQDRPAQYRSQKYYENWNQQYVNAWNYRATQPNNSFFEPIIGYDYTTDYGFELNHKLFYYFQYVERVLKIGIMPGGPRSIVF